MLVFDERDKHHHPDRQTITRILKVPEEAGADDHAALCFNYLSDENEIWDSGFPDPDSGDMIGAMSEFSMIEKVGKIADPASEFVRHESIETAERFVRVRAH